MDPLSKKYYKINEVAELMGESQSTLRYWEQEFPECRAARSGTNRRAYTPRQIENLHKVQYLLRVRGLKIEAARRHLLAHPSTVSNRLEIIAQLETVRDDLKGLLKAMEKRRD